MAQSIGQVGNERAHLEFSQAILDSFPPTADIHKLDTVANLTPILLKAHRLQVLRFKLSKKHVGWRNRSFFHYHSIDTSKSCGAFLVQ